MLQGCGRQRQGAPFVIVSYYLVGLPLASALGFGAKLGVQGMVLGMLVGKLCHALSFGCLVWTTDWESEVHKAAERLAGESAHHAAGALPPATGTDATHPTTAHAGQAEPRKELVEEAATDPGLPPADSEAMPSAAEGAACNGHLSGTCQKVPKATSRRYAKLDEDS